MNKILKRISVFLFVFFCVTAFSTKASAATEFIVAGDVRWGENHTGKIAKDGVVYNFSLEQSGKVAVTFTYSDSNVDNYRFVIRDKAGNNLVYEHVGNGTHTVSADLLAGDYEIAMWQYVYFNKDLSYSFVPSFQASGETISESLTTKNNEVGCASSYNLNETRVGQFAINDDTDIYKVTLNKSGTLKFTVNSELKSMNISIQNEMDDVSYTEYGVQIGNHTYSYFCPKGTYYITLTSSNSGLYTFNTSMKGIPTVSMKKVTNVKTRRLKVTWTRSAAVSGYQIQYSTDSKFKKNNKSIVFYDPKISSTTFSSLKAKKKYYVRVRTFMTDQNGRKYYSSWSKAKSATIKK